MLKSRLIQVSLKFTLAENGLGSHAPIYYFPRISRRAFSLSGDEPKLAGKPFIYWEMSLFSGIVYLKHSIKVKLNFSESEFQWNFYRT